MTSGRHDGPCCLAVIDVGVLATSSGAQSPHQNFPSRAQPCAPVSERLAVNGNTPLHLSCDRGFVGNVKLLLEWGADPKAVNEAGNVPSEVSPTQVETKICRFQGTSTYGTIALSTDPIPARLEHAAGARGRWLPKLRLRHSYSR